MGFFGASRLRNPRAGDARAPSVAWSDDGITDEGFRERFATVPRIIESWVSPRLELKEADILDFGCGEGLSALAFALRYRARRVVGVDIMPDPERCLSRAAPQLGLAALPENLELHGRVQPGRLHDLVEKFDLVYAWSVFEHVDQEVLGATLELLRNSLRPGGLLFIQIAPLYYSAHGSHLTHRIAEPWGHLRAQHSVLHERLAAAVPDPAECRALWSMYRTLNRITAQGLQDRIRRAGFRILRCYETKDALPPPEDLCAIFREEALATNQVVVLAS